MYLNSAKDQYKTGKISLSDYVESTLVSSQTILINANDKNTVKNRISYDGRTTTQYWLNGKKSSLLSRLGGYDPALKEVKVQKVEVSYTDGKFEATVDGQSNKTYSTFFNQTLPKPQDTSGNKIWEALALIPLAASDLADQEVPGVDAATDAATVADVEALMSEETLDETATEAELAAEAEGELSSVESGDIEAELEQEASELEKISAKNLDELPENVQSTYSKYEDNGWQGNVKGQTEGTGANGKWTNNDLELPTRDSDGNPITYKEFDVNSKIDGQSRDGERFLHGSDGSVYYTDSHYGDGDSLNNLPPYVRIK
jgi:hypothetical protein